MKILDRHIRNTVIVSVLILASLVTVVDLVFAMSDELSSANENYPAISAFSYVVFNTPTRIYELLPFAVLGGALIGLGVLASNNEILIMQAAGIKVWRLVWSVLKPAIAIMILNLLLGEYVAPPLEHMAQTTRALHRSGNANIGSWQKVGSEFIHIDAIVPGGESLYGVARYRIDENRHLIGSSLAESAEYIRNEEGGFWRLYNVQESLFEQDRITEQKYLEVDWKVDLSPNLLSVLIMVPDRQSMAELYRFAQFFDAEGLDATEYFLAFWKKLLQPIATIALVILAISFVFGPLRESTMGMRVFTAIGIGLGFTIIQRLLEPASLLYGFSPLLAATTPILIAFVLGTMLLHRVR